MLSHLSARSVGASDSPIGADTHELRTPGRSRAWDESLVPALLGSAGGMFRLGFRGWALLETPKLRGEKPAPGGVGPGGQSGIVGGRRRHNTGWDLSHPSERASPEGDHRPHFRAGVRKRGLVQRALQPPSSSRALECSISARARPMRPRTRTAPLLLADPVRTETLGRGLQGLVARFRSAARLWRERLGGQGRSSTLQFRVVPPARRAL